MKAGPNPTAYAILCAGALVIGGGACAWQTTRVMENLRLTADLRAQVLENRDIEARLAESEKRLEEAKRQLAHLEQGLPEAAYIPSFLRDLEQLGNRSGVTVTGVRPQPNASGKDGEKSAQAPYRDLALEIRGTGPYRSLQRLLENLEQFPMIVSVKQLVLNPDSRRTDSTRSVLEITVQAETFIFPADPAAESGSRQARGDRDHGDG